MRHHLQFRIAEHNVAVATDSDTVKDWLGHAFAVPDPEQSKGGDAHLRIAIESGHGLPFVNFDVAANRAGDGSIVYERGDYTIRMDASCTEAWIGVHDMFALKHAMMNVYSTYIVHAGWGLLVHSSCVAQNGKAYLFSGHSGAGKSTVAMLSLPRPLLSDEATVVKLEADGGATAFDSPFRSDLWTYHSMERCPLEGIFFLRQSPAVETKRMSEAKGFLSILDKVFYWKYDAAETAEVFRMCRRLTAAVPVHELYFQKNDSFWEMIS
ncbi:MAG TPA: hypothetical protein VMS09_10480 [Paenibacillus sp.]|uniref:hypothetical protein n=1 Tax=Paenibacillus sp. TaxID=58172 RepID=UPI002BAD5D3F|nr:hypothetical protein [Paenibacillus sp.]HUC92440.1 hypothetical protein [Paenibacillus sp.]